MFQAAHSHRLALIAAIAVALRDPGAVSAQSKMPGWAGHVQTGYSIDKHALKAPPQVEGSVAKLAAYLVQPTQDIKFADQAALDIRKVHAIYRWMSDRLTYQPDKGGDRAPEKVLQARAGNNEEYVRLFKALCAEAGIEAIRISGYVKGPDSKPGDALKTNHVWNAVKIGKIWELVDVTLGSYELNPQTKKWGKRYQEYYCFTPPERLAFTHFPEDPAHQFLPKPVSAEKFRQRLVVPDELLKHGADPAKIQACVDKPGFRGFVKLNWDRKFPLLLIDVPLEKHLKQGRYPFYFAAPLTPRIMIGDSKTFLTKNGTVYSADLTLEPGRFQLKIPEGKRTILEYEVE
jgi:hypothetical protein